MGVGGRGLGVGGWVVGGVGEVGGLGGVAGWRGSSGGGWWWWGRWCAGIRMYVCMYLHRSVSLKQWAASIHKNLWKFSKSLSLSYLKTKIKLDLTGGEALVFQQVKTKEGRGRKAEGVTHSPASGVLTINFRPIVQQELNDLQPPFPCCVHQGGHVVPVHSN